MIDKSRRFSYSDQKKNQHKLRWVVIWVLGVFLVYACLTSFFSIRVLENDSMQPGLQKGDYLVFSSYRIYQYLPDPDISSFLRRGNIVLIDKTLSGKTSFIRLTLDGFIRFITGQRISLIKTEDNLFVKRLIGLPGDEITMTNFVIRIKPADERYTFTEFELWDRPYETQIPSIPALWDDSLPFSGNMETIILKEDEYFVLSDDRSNTNDSRTWGPVPITVIGGKALFRYWPITRVGLP